MITVHLILNAHLDPVWLWPWQAGLDSAIGTCLSACDRLDAHPDIVFTRGEAWVYRQIERINPDLFSRILKHVEAGRWEIVNGWWIQPDCNLPSDFAMKKQIELGRRFFQDRFGFFPGVAYNVDSFGHAATLPTMMRAASQDRYVMMRPQPLEMQLPARLFRWREAAGKPEVVTFRIANSYCNWQPTEQIIRQSTTDLPKGIQHTMCFLGIGDHGGGPSERLIAWCRKHQDAFPGCRLEFSSTARFFDSVAGQTDLLPVVTGELQHHAIGCYSVHRPIKLGVRKAEHLLRQAEIAVQHDPRPELQTHRQLDLAWQQVCFHHFHDTLGGTCIPSAYAQVDAQLGMARAIADELIHVSVRRQMVPLPDDTMQRIILFNASDARFDSFVEFEPWLEWLPWQSNWKLRDESGQVVPSQLLQSEASTHGMTRLLFRVAADPGQMRILKIDQSTPGDKTISTNGITASLETVANSERVAIHLGQTRQMRFGDSSLTLPRLEMIDDVTDTWSHGVDRFPEGPADGATWEPPMLADAGPLMGSLIQRGHLGKSQLTAEYRVCAGMPYVELLLRVHWIERRKILKLFLGFHCNAVTRFDGIMGGELERPMSGREVPLRDRTLVELSDGNRVGIVCPDVFAMDATPVRLRLTLLRSPIMAHHEPHHGPTGREVIADQGPHCFRFRFFHGRTVPGETLDLVALAMQRCLIAADLTRGMPPKDASEANFP